MRKLILILVLISTTSIAFGQQEPLRSNYRFNHLIINPGATGSSGLWDVKAGYRNQWTKFPGAPVTLSLSVDGMPFEKMGLGLMAFSDVVGPEEKQGVQLSYAYHVPVGSGYLGLGIAGRGYRWSLNPELVSTDVPLDPAVLAAMGEKNFVGDLNFGVYYHSESLYGGVSVPQLLQLTDSEIIELERHIYGMLGYKMDLGNVTLDPSLMLRFVPGDAPFNYDVNLQAWFIERQLMFGLGYRAGNYLSFMTGFSVQDKYNFAYVYDYGLNEFQGHSLGAHEIRLGYSFGTKKINYTEGGAGE